MMLPMSPQQQFELAKQIAVSNPDRLKAVLRGTPDPIFKDLSIAMMALQGAEEERRAWEGMQASQQAKQPSLREAMSADMDREDAELGGVANLQAPNMDIPGGGVAGEEEPPVVQAAGGGAIKRFNGETGSVVPGADDYIFRGLVEQLKKRKRQFSEWGRGTGRFASLADSTGTTLAPAAELSPYNIGGADVAGGMYESVLSRLEPKAGSARAAPSPDMLRGSPRAARGAPAAAAPAPAAAASPGIAALAASPDADAVADMVDYRGQGLPGAEASADTGLGAYDPATIREQIRAARKRNLEEAKAATAPQWEALQKMWSKDEANREEKLGALEREKRGVAALEAAMRLGQSGKTGMSALAEAFGAAGGVGAKYGAERRKMQTAFDEATEKRASANLAYEQGNFKLATSLADQEQKHVDAAAKLVYDVEHKRALRELEGLKLTEEERKNRAAELATNKAIAVRDKYYSVAAVREHRADIGAQRQLILGEAQIIKQQLADLTLPMNEKKNLNERLNSLMAQLQSLGGIASAAKAPSPSDFSDELPSGSRVVGKLVP